MEDLLYITTSIVISNSPRLMFCIIVTLISNRLIQIIHFNCVVLLCKQKVK